ncbi:unnamed protein product [Diatraea saccharalis]|uniref:Uncharacterized protein n=1 Tax=Diatraea saccharalis TaxID=40085 RepID=A0A9N9WDP4_9NEOP|nr:unnamed protein product [Diatraea saccharalis]
MCQIKFSYGFLVLVSLLNSIKSDIGVIKEQRKIASRPQPENNLDKTPVHCEDTPVKSKNPLPYFRRQVEEVTDNLALKKELNEDSRSNLVSLLIKNAKEIYSELDEANTETSTTVTRTTTTCTSIVTSWALFDNNTIDNITYNDLIGHTIAFTIKTTNDTNSTSRFQPIETITNKTRIIVDFDSDNHEIAKDNEILISYKNATLMSFSDIELVNMDIATNAYELVEKDELMPLSKNLILFETDPKGRDQKKDELSGQNVTVVDLNYFDRVRSCIYCNNLEMESCNDPKNRLIPSRVCERDDDLCYSLHTPFGVIDRGCFNVNHNLTTYVCSCNLCNYISISEMPYIFSKKQDWIDNVIELARMRKFRRSVMKEMACLKCEANLSLKNSNTLETSNCLHGNL